MKAFLTLFLVAATTVAADATETPAQNPVLGTDTVHGCYSSMGSLVFNQSTTFNTQGLCTAYCRDMGSSVAAAQSKDCYCGDKYPPKNTLVDDSECTEPCPGYDTQVCGGYDTWTVYNTGVRISVSDEANTSDTSSYHQNSSSSAVPSTSVVIVVSAGLETITPTITPTDAAITTTATPIGSTTVPAGSTTTPAGTSGANSQHALNGLTIAVLGMGAVFLL